LNEEEEELVTSAETTVLIKSAGMLDACSLFRDAIFTTFIVELKKSSLWEWVPTTF
jgi:hypothetical protein